MSREIWWETIELEDDGQGNRLLERMQIPGGWLVRSREIDRGGCTMTSSITFVPDPDYKWSLE